MENSIFIKNARLHNLKNISVEIPKNKLVVLTGVSGSGKSTLGFDILNKEGQRQYLESLGLVTYGVSHQPVDSITGLSPSISVDQHLTNHSPRSTVGTTTEVFTYLRVLYARLCHRPCPSCHEDVPPPTFETLESESDLETDENPDGSFPCPHCGSPVQELGMANFSFNKPEGACPTCTGLGTVRQVLIEKMIDGNLSLKDNGVVEWDRFHLDYYAKILESAGHHYGFIFDVNKPLGKYSSAERDLLLYGTDSRQLAAHFPGVKPPATNGAGRFEGIVTNLLRRYDEHAENASYRDKLEQFFTAQVCPDCGGTRLRPESRVSTILGKTIIEISRLPISKLYDWLRDLQTFFNDEEMLLARPILDDLDERINRLIEVGAGYLTLERASPSLSAGETQRLRLASLLGSGLTGVMYVLDEPTIGLHSRDTKKLIGVLRKLRDLGNTVLVIEHDLDFIKAADYLIDFGPGAGKHGGELMASGTPDQVAKTAGSVTGAFISGSRSVPIPIKFRPADGDAIVVRGARQFNLKDLTVRLPLGILCAITGVSGSGKSSLMFEIVDRAARKHFYQSGDQPGEHDSIEGWEYIDKIITIDQEHIGRIPRSNAATYTDTFTPIRSTFASTQEAIQAGLSPRHFSFNVPGGRCERCEGAGTLTVKMHFLPEVEVRCPVCHGHRFNKDVLKIRYREKNISDVLDLTIDEALKIFQDIPAAAARLQIMSDIGLGYLQLGQPATTLSGGEAQRIKLAKELGRRSSGKTLYLLDEPTTGLHPADTSRLLVVLQRLVDAGNSVMVIEHNLDLIKAADWVIDLGPEGGDEGGYLLAEGTPEQIAKVAESHTGNCLKNSL